MQVHVLGAAVAAAAVASAAIMTGSGLPWAYEFEEAGHDGLSLPLTLVPGVLQLRTGCERDQVASKHAL